MNNETNIVQSKPKTPGKKRAKKAVAFLLVVAILITSAYAFLTAHQTKTNVFTVGNIRLELHEDGWEANSALTNKQYDGTTYENGTQYISSSKLENIIPGEPITKDPMIKNVGKNPAYVFISVDMPTVKIDNEWVDIFDTGVLENNSIKYNENWTLFKTINTDDTHRNVYYFYYSNSTNNPENTLNVNSETPNLFDFVVLKESLYNNINIQDDFAIEINAYGSQTIGVNNIEEAWEKIVEKDSTLPSMTKNRLTYLKEDSSIYARELLLPGEPIEMKYDSSLVKENNSFEWVTLDGQDVYEGMPMPNTDLVLTANYTEYEFINDDTTGYYIFEVIQDETTGEFSAFAHSIDQAKAPANLETITIPSTITFTPVENEQSVTTTDGDIVQGLYINNNPVLPLNQEITLTVTHTYQGLWSNVDTIKNVNLPALLTTLSTVGTSVTDNHTININFPYSLRELKNQALVNLKALDEVVFPSSVTKIGNMLLANSHVNTLIIPQSVQTCKFTDTADVLEGNTVIINSPNVTLYHLGNFKNYIINASFPTQSLDFEYPTCDSTDENKIINIVINGHLFEASNISLYSYREGYQYNYTINGTLGGSYEHEYVSGGVTKTETKYSQHYISPNDTYTGSGVIEYAYINPSSISMFNSTTLDNITINHLCWMYSRNTHTAYIGKNINEMWFNPSVAESITIYYYGSESQFKNNFYLIQNSALPMETTHPRYNQYYNQFFSLATIYYNQTF